ncbi:hypothetical protein F4680DRAFT_441532 [Xylaria scruposa]|nr:hypothetical protein F4680DRAFT_441532 [Xylaria scruposa]
MSEVAARLTDREGQDPPEAKIPRKSETSAYAQLTSGITGESLTHTYEDQASMALQEPRLDADGPGTQKSHAVNEDSLVTDIHPAGTANASHGSNESIKNFFPNPENALTSHSEAEIEELENESHGSPASTNRVARWAEEVANGAGPSPSSNPPKARGSIPTPYRRPAPSLDLYSSSEVRWSDVSDPSDPYAEEEGIHRLRVRFMGARDRKSKRDGKPKKTVAQRVNLIADINCMGWVEFAGPKTSLTRQLDISAIDVLIGEPHIDVDVRGEDTTTEEMQSKQQNFKERLDTTEECKTTNDGLQFRMRSPERIRLNSQQLINFLFGNVPDKSMTIVRPFRILLHKEERIRAFYQTLELEARPTADSINEQQSDPTSTAPTGTKATALEIMGCLVRLMDEYILPRIKFVRDLDCTRIHFDELWYLFKPGDHVFRFTGGDMAVDIEVLRVICVQGVEHIVKLHRKGPPGSQQSPLEIHCVAIDFDGKQLGPRLVHCPIDHFEGENAVRSLPIMPINRLRDEEVQQRLIHNGIDFTECRDDDEILHRLVARGKAFFDMTEMRHMHFNGTTPFGEELDCPVMIDFDQAFASREAQGRWDEGQRLPGWKPDLKSFVEWTPPNIDTTPCRFECCRHRNVYIDRSLDRENSVAYLDSLTRSTKSKMHSLAIHPRYRHEANAEENRIKDDEFLIMPWRVYGFVFQIRKFRPLSVSQVTPIKDPNKDSINEKSRRYDGEEAFDQLVLPDGHQDMIKSLIAQHFNDKQTPSVKQDPWDLVRGKDGAPGVGKTSTAECVADYFRKPLFQLTCGDLGMWAEQVESALQQTFALAGRWGCILLLDEADVFLSARTPTDLLRNSIVSVFLRVIEYYSGILFLTTNRVGDFDEAFASRIHMSLYYPPLDHYATISVFNLNMNRLQRRSDRKGIRLEVEKSKIEAYATQHWYRYPGARWNGRQIRNACQTALALAEFEVQGGNHEAVIDPNVVVRLKVKHFETVANSYLGFMNYLTDIYGVNFDERAKENFMRAGVKNDQAPSPQNSIFLRKHDAEPASYQIFDGHHRTRQPLNPFAQDPGLSTSFRQPYLHPNNASFQTNMGRPQHMYAQYPQSQGQMQQTPPSGSTQSGFLSVSQAQNSTYLQNIQEGLPQTSEQAQQIQQGQHLQPTHHPPMVPPQANGPPIQPSPPTTVGPGPQYISYPTRSQAWP